MIKELEGADIAQAVGHYIVLYFRKKDYKYKYVVRLMEIDMENLQMKYEIISGPNKGRVRIGKFIKDRPLMVYDEDSLVKALLER